MRNGFSPVVDPSCWEAELMTLSKISDEDFYALQEAKGQNYCRVRTDVDNRQVRHGIYFHPLVR